jgi:Arc/MetJ-type ribon-helix-helix transcriptional regulator
VTCGETSTVFTRLSVPVMTRLHQPQRQVLDTLVEAGVAKSRSEALAWCVRLVAQHEGDWLAELDAAMTAVRTARAKGPSA